MRKLHGMNACITLALEQRMSHRKSFIYCVFRFVCRFGRESIIKSLVGEKMRAKNSKPFGTRLMRDSG